MSTKRCDSQTCKYIISSFVDQLCKRLWPGCGTINVDLSVPRYSGSRTIRAEFDKSAAAIKWEKFLHIVSSITADVGVSEYGICSYIHGLLMQMFKARCALMSKIMVYAKPGVKLQDDCVLLRCKHIKGHTVLIRLNFCDSVSNIRHLLFDIDFTKFVSMEMEDFVVIIDDTVVIPFGGDNPKEFMKYRSSDFNYHEYLMCVLYKN